MTALAGRRMSETVARRGGLTVFPQDVEVAAIDDMTRAVKRADLVVETAITLTPADTVNAAMDLIHKRAHGAVIVVDDSHHPIGIFVETDGAQVDRFTPLSAVMTPDPISIAVSLDPKSMYDALTEQRLHLAPVVDADGPSCGCHQ